MKDTKDSANESFYVPRLTMKTVWDIRNGIEIDAQTFFEQPESEIINMRRLLQLAINTRQPLLICPHCHQMVKISGRKYLRGKAVFFSHLYDSEECPIKTTTGLSKEFINASKYGLVTESFRHIRLKNLIAQSLNSPHSMEKGVTNVQIEKKVDSSLPYLRWRRPDVMAKFKNKNLVFELQLSTTFISTIVDRDLFYRLNDYYIIWVFNFEDNKEYFNLSNLMCKDIYYANKRNVFIFDKEAQDESERRGELILKCNWLDADNSWHYKKKGKEAVGILVSLNQLSFDEENKKLYFYDADADYFSRYPNLLEKRKQMEISRSEIVEGLIKREREENDEFNGQTQEQRDNATSEMLMNGGQVEVFKKKNRFGMEYGNTIIIPAKYTSISGFDDAGYATLKFNRYMGLADRLGNIVVPCVASEIIPLGNRYFIYRKSVNNWFLTGVENPVAPYYKDNVWLTRIDDYVEIVEISNSSYKHKDHCLYIINGIIALFQDCSDDSEKWGAKYINGETVLQFEYDNVLYENNFFVIETKGMKGLVDYDMNQIIPPQFSAFSFITDKIIITKKIRPSLNSNTWPLLPNSYMYGMFHYDGKLILDCDHDFIKYLGNKFVVSKNGQWAVVDEDGNIVCPYQDNSIIKISDKYLYMKDKNGLFHLSDHNGNILNWEGDFSNIQETNKLDMFVVTSSVNKKEGIVDILGNVIIPCNYDKLLPWGNHLFRVEQIQNTVLRSRWGGAIYNKKEVKLYYLINENNDRIDEETYISLNFPAEGKAYAKTKEGLEGYLDDKGKQIIDEKIPLGDSYQKMLTFERWGLVNNEGNIILPFQFLDITLFNSKLLKVKTSRSKYKLYNLVGKSISKTYSNIGNFSDGYAKADDTYLNENGEECFMPVEQLPNGNVIGHNLNGFGLYDKEGSVLSEPVFLQIEFWDGSFLLYHDIRNNKKIVSVHDMDGNEIGENIYDKIEPFVSDKCKAWIGEEFCYLDRNARELTDIVSTMPDGNVIFKSFGKFGLYDSLGNILLSAKYTDIVYLDTNAYFALNSHLYKLVDANNSCISNESITKIGNIKDGVADITVEGKGECKIDKQGNLFPISQIFAPNGIRINMMFGKYMVDRDGDTLAKYGIYKNITTHTDNSFSAVRCSDNKPVILDCDFCEINLTKDFSKFIYIEQTNHLITCIKKDMNQELRGLIDTNGKEIVPPKCESLEFESKVNVYIAKRINGNYKLINRDGLIIPGEFDKIEGYSDKSTKLWIGDQSEFLSNGQMVLRKIRTLDNGMFVYQWFKGYGLAYDLDTIVTGPYFSTISEWGDDLLLCKYANERKCQYSLLNSEGTSVAKGSYISSLKDGVAFVKNHNANTYYIDSQGMPVLHKIRIFDNYYLTTYGGMYGLMDNNSNTILEERYNEIVPLHGGMFKITEKDGVGIANTDGVILIPCENSCIFSFSGKLVCIKEREIIKTNIDYEYQIPVPFFVNDKIEHSSGLILQVGKKTAYMQELNLIKAGYTSDQFRHGDEVKAIINYINWEKGRIYARFPTARDISYIDGQIIQVEVVSRMPYAIIARDVDNNNIFIHRSMISSSQFNKIKLMNTLNIKKIGFDKQHKKDIWKIIDDYSI